MSQVVRTARQGTVQMQSLRNPAALHCYPGGVAAISGNPLGGLQPPRGTTNTGRECLQARLLLANGGGQRHRGRTIL
jgi:hypothetical protein